ncbi:MAG: hypothetical protein V4751_01090 [Pseudomonadota bacterium]
MISPLLKYPAILPLGLLYVSAVFAQEPGVPSARHNLSVGGYYSSGDYGESSKTTIHYLPVSYDYTAANWNLKLAVPYLEVSGAGNVLVNVGGIGSGDFNGLAVTDESVRSRGRGDTVLTATYQFPAFAENLPFIDLGVEVKIPTADEKKSLGTGETDYGVQLDLYQLAGDTTLFATAGYKFRGRSFLFNEMTDSAYLSLGFSRPLSQSWSYGLIYDYREAASESSKDTHELLPYLSWSPASRWTLMGYLVKGFTRDSADYALGGQLSYRW